MAQNRRKDVISCPKSLGLRRKASLSGLAEASIGEQPKGKELGYRSIAVNKAGESEPSNTEVVVL